MPANDLMPLGGIQKIVAGGARPGLIFRRDSFFPGGNPAKTPVRQSPETGHEYRRCECSACLACLYHRIHTDLAT